MAGPSLWSCAHLLAERRRLAAIIVVLMVVAVYAAIEDQRESSRATKDDLSLGAVSFTTCEDTQSEKMTYPTYETSMTLSPRC